MASRISGTNVLPYFKQLVKLTISSLSIEDEFIDNILKSDKITKLHIDSFCPFNPKILDLSNCTNMFKKFTSLKLKGIVCNNLPVHEMRNLRVLSLNHYNKTIFNVVHNLSQVTQLDLSNTEIGGSLHLIQMPNLKELILFQCNINNDDLTHLSNIKSLVNLKIRRNNITSIEPIEKMINLHYLDLSYNALSNFHPIYKLINLRQLYMDNCNINGTIDIRGLNKLSVLNISYNKVEFISLPQSLTELYIHNTNIYRFDFLKNTTNLLILRVTNCVNLYKYNQLLYNPLSACKNLTDISFDYISIDNCFDHIIQMKSLKNIYIPTINSNIIPTKYIKQLISMPSLLYIDVPHNAELSEIEYDIVTATKSRGLIFDNYKTLFEDVD